MFEIISIDEHDKWNDIVSSFPNWDTYYTNEYAKSFALHGDGKASLIHFESEGFRLCYPVMIRDLAESEEFCGMLASKLYYDIETPYGYGGPLANVESFPEKIQQQFYKEMNRYCLEQKIVSQFIRFHPLLHNQTVLNRVIESKTIKDTVYIDLTNEDTIFQNMDSKNRNMVRKAQRSNIVIENDVGEHISAFIDIYRETMDRAKAEDYYYFEDPYYDYILKNMKDQIIIFYAKMEGEIIAASMFFYNNHFMHYHLSGCKTSFRKFAPTNLLLYEAACWGSRKGIKILHLGGGIGNEDSLFGFKKQFNKYGRLPFYIGRTIFNHEWYSELMTLRRSVDLNFDSHNNFYIEYRKPKEIPMHVYVIAEAGDNHNGNFDLALQLVDVAKAAGADCVKFQTFITEEIISTYAEKAEYQKKSTGVEENQFDMVKKLELSFEEFRKIKQYCDKVGIQFLSTPFDIPSVEFLEEMDMPFWKIPSGEITNLPYLIKLAQTGKDIVLSTGMCTMEDIESAIKILKDHGCGKISLLHCNTEYPTPFEDVNLLAMNTLRDKFHCPVGYSDHTAGIEVPIAATAMGASIVEKHFTLDKNMDGPDHKASLEPLELKEMIKAIRNIEKALGCSDKKPSPSETKNIAIARKSITARTKILKGTTLTEENLAIKRPGNGISPMKWYDVIGTEAIKDFEKDELIVL